MQHGFEQDFLSNKEIARRSKLPNKISIEKNSLQMSKKTDVLWRIYFGKTKFSKLNDKTDRERSPRK